MAPGASDAMVGARQKGDLADVGAILQRAVEIVGRELGAADAEIRMTVGDDENLHVTGSLMTALTRVLMVVGPAAMMAPGVVAGDALAEVVGADIR